MNEDEDYLIKHLNKAQQLIDHIVQKIRDVCKEDEIYKLLLEEYLCINSFDHTDEQKKDHLKAVYQMDEETYDQNATKIAEYRDELGLSNPFSEFKPYVMTESKLVTLQDVRQRIGKIYDEMERLPSEEERRQYRVYLNLTKLIHAS